MDTSAEHAVLLPAASLQRPAGRCCRCTPSTVCRTVVALHAREYRGLRDPPSSVCHGQDILLETGCPAGERLVGRPANAGCQLDATSCSCQSLRRSCFGTADRAQRTTRRGPIYGRSSAAVKCCGQLQFELTGEGTRPLRQARNGCKFAHRETPVSSASFFCTGLSVCAVLRWLGGMQTVRFVTWVQLADYAS
jgi:hypothetical protein